MSIKEYFTKNCINISAYARANELDIIILHKVLDGKLTGERKTTGATKKVFEVLFRDGIITNKPNVLRAVKSA